MYVLTLVLLLLLTINEPSCAEDCNDGAGECKSIKECIPAQFLSFRQIKFCNPRKSIVCCPKEKIMDPYISEEEKDLVSVKECIGYRSQVYNSKCVSHPLIVGGTKAGPKELPHLALVGLKRVNNTPDWFCAGTLISPSYVISAAHCFYQTYEPDIIRLGELDYNSTEDDAQPQDFNIKHFVVHPGYDDSENYNDLVLILMDGKATLNNYVVPACLPLSNGTEFKEYTAAGWGAIKFAKKEKPTHLLKVNLERFNDDQCKDLVDITSKLNKGITERTQLCAGSYTEEKDTCQGDSGGPLFVEHPDFNCMYLLIGVTSFGSSCGNPGIPGVYVRVNLYLQWIEQVVWNATSLI